MNRLCLTGPWRGTGATGSAQGAGRAEAQILANHLRIPDRAEPAHHHGDQETILYVISGTSRFRWGDKLESVAEAGPGDFVFIPGHVSHQEIHASPEAETVWVVVRSGVDPIVVNLPELDAFAEPAAVEYTHP
ncbi:cupin domain-containing protein [Streptomyces sp. NPDC086777]|uniref:cupin domain-containing protein n=1 Tax=Streptomyces sp. NPDC086777 TaxID=3154866 RepID=UPI00344FC09A